MGLTLKYTKASGRGKCSQCGETISEGTDQLVVRMDWGNATGRTCYQCLMKMIEGGRDG